MTRDRARRSIKPPDRFGFADVVHYALCVADLEADNPNTYEEAMNSEHSEDWKRAMDSEIHSLRKNMTWILVKNENNRKVVSCKWIFRYKEGIKGIEEARFKARLVA